MDFRVGRVDELAGNEAVGESCGQFLRLGNGSLHAQRAVRQHQFRAVGLQQVAAFHAHRFRHGQDDPVPAGGGHRRQADARVPAGGFNDDGIRLQLSGGFRGVNHGPGDAVLHAAGGVEVFQLGQDSGVQAVFAFVIGQLQQRRAADQFCNVSVNSHGL